MTQDNGASIDQTCATCHHRVLPIDERNRGICGCTIYGKLFRMPHICKHWREYSEEDQ